MLLKVQLWLQILIANLIILLQVCSQAYSYLKYTISHPQLIAMKFTPGVNFQNDWKLINLQIGSNDQCASCIDTVYPLLTPEKYGQHVTAAVERIRKNIPRVIVNLSKTVK